MEVNRKAEVYGVIPDKKPWLKYLNITVEPTMFFYMMAFMITSVVEQTFYVFRACTVDHGYSEEICYEINKHEEINNEVQVTTSVFHQWNGIASHIVPLLLAFFLGSYSDKRGRKFILLAGLVGKLYFSAMITLNTIKAWPLNYVIYTATFPSALTGADLAIFAGCFAYIADVSSLKNRTLRVGILDVVYLSTLPTGVAIGNVLYNNVVDRSFTAMFAINTCLMLVATLHCLLFLEWQTSSTQKTLKQAGVKNPIADFFDVNNIKKTLVTLTKRRRENRRLFLWFLLISMAFYTFQRDERPVMYLYTSLVFQWDATDFSNFRTYLSTAYVVVMLFGIPLMTKVFNWRDTVIIMLGAAAHVSGHLLYAHATVAQLMYAGATAAALGPCVAPLIRSMTSKVLPASERGALSFARLLYAHATVAQLMYAGATAAALGPCVAPLIRSMTSRVLPASERGVAYAFLSVMENAVAMFASVIYTQIYKATITTDYINSIFYLTMATQAIVFILALSMDILLKGQSLEALSDEDQEQISNNS